MKQLNMIVPSLVVLIGLVGCGGGGGGSEIQTKLKSTITINVTDADAGFLKKDAELTFLGLPVTDPNGVSVSTKRVLKDMSNIVTLEVETIGSDSQELRIIADADGYLATGNSVLIQPNVNNYTLNIKMVEEMQGKVSDGIYMNEIDISSMVDNSGKVIKEIILESDPSAPIKTRINIPVNTVMLDENGNPVLNASLKLMSFDPTSTKALEAFPGGFDVIADATGFTHSDGTVASGNEEINFKTAGFVAIEITGDNDKKVKTFNQDVEVAMQFRVGTTDGDGNVVVAGDAVPIWSYDENTAKWSYEQDGTAQINSNDSTLMDVVYNIRHLSYYNLDWHYGNVCSANINVIDSLGVNALTGVDHFSISIPGANLYRNNIVPWGSNSDGLLVLYNVPSGYTDGIVTAYDSNGIVIGSVGPTDLCGGTVGTGGWSGTSFDNEVDLTLNTTTTTVNVTTTFSCPNNNIPGYNSSTIAFDAILTNMGGGITQLTGGSGNVVITGSGSTTFDISANTSQSHLFSVIDPNNSNNPPNNQITINSNSTSFTQNFVLTNAFCNPLSGQINGDNGTSCGLTVSPNTGPRIWDVAQSSNGDIYISHTTGGIMKSAGGTGVFTTVIPQSNSLNTMPTTTSSPTSSVTVDQPRGLDLVKLFGIDEYLYYTDKGGHCVNAIDLATNNVITVAGICGTSGDTTSTISNQLNSTIALLNEPYDVAYSGATGSLFISDKGNKKIKMIDLNNWMWTVAGDGNTPTTNISPNPPSALTTSIEPYMLDVDSHGQVVFSTGLRNRVIRVEAIDFAVLNPGSTAELRQLAGNFNIAGQSGDGGLATSSTLYYPADIEIDHADNILIANRYIHKIRRIDALSNVIDTVAGTGAFNNPTQCGQATTQNIRAPYGLWIQNNGDFYFTQTPSNNNGANNFSSLRHVTY